MTMEVLSPHPAGNYRALVSEETDDPGDADPAGPRRARQHRSRASAARQEHRQTELATGDTLADLAGARTLMQEVDDLLKRRPGLGTLVGEAAALRALLVKQRGWIVPGPSALTAAELRLLPMLATHLPVREIAAEMYLSPHTVRTQAQSVYRKLGASTSSQAVARARELGLLEG